MIKLSFLIATYNCAQEVDSLAAVAREWAGMPVEFCVVDGGSKDGTAEALRHIDGVRLVVSEPDAGIYDAWNKAVAAANGEYFAFIGIDDRPSKAFFDRVSQFLDTVDVPPKVLFGNAVFVRGNLWRNWTSPTNPKLFSGADVDFDFPHPGSYNHRSLFDGLRFDPSYRLAGDFDFYLHARQRPGFSWKKIDAVQAEIGTDGASRSAGSSHVYRLERARAAERSGIAIATPTFKRQALEFIERFPRVFNVLKHLAWMIRGRTS